MSRSGEAGAIWRSPLTLGITGALIGIVLALALGAFGSFGDPTGSASPTLPGTVTPSPSLLAIASDEPSPSLSPGPTTEPTSPPNPTATPPTAGPSPTPNTNPRIATWDVPQLEDCTTGTAGMIHVAWSVKRASGVSISIDGPGIYDTYARLTGEEDIPFGCGFEAEHTYTLRTVGGTGPAASLTRTVRVRPPSVTSFQMGDAVCGPGDNFVGIAMSYEIRAATGAELRRDGQLYSTYGVKATDDIVMYDCSKPTQVWSLTTTGGYDDPATKQVTVERRVP